MSVSNEVRQIKADVEDDLLDRPGINAVDIGYKYVGGQKTDQVAIRVYVDEKRDVSTEESIPDNIQGVVTDVIQRKIVLHTLSVPESSISLQADTGRYEPLKGGISIGPCRTIGGSIFVGTLGAIVKDNATGNPMMLSNFHVMCVDTGWSVGDTLAQPGRVDSGRCPSDIVGTLQRASLGGQVDCAVASITDRSHACEIIDVGSVTGTSTATLGMPIRKRGRTTSLTYGTVDSIDLTVSVDYGPGLGFQTLRNQIGIKVDSSRSPQFGNSGDSGSVVIDNDRKVVGLYFAGSADGSFGVANPIQVVLDTLNVRLCVAPVKSIIKEIRDGKGGKEIKLEKAEKREKIEFKEGKIEKREKIEFKEGKIEKREFEKPNFDKPSKELVEGPDLNIPINPALPALSLEQRLAELESILMAMQASPQDSLKKVEFKENSEKSIKESIKDSIKEVKEKDFKEKDRKEFKDKDKDHKEFKDKDRKEFKDTKEFKEKDRKEFKEKDRKEFREKDFKEFKEKDAEVPDVDLPVIPQFPSLPNQPSLMEERLAYLEATLAHFIGPDLRPDLATGALNRESDLSGTDQAALSQQLQKQASDAKQMKDNKDIEKMREM
jgi:hypothetical protein